VTPSRPLRAVAALVFACVALAGPSRSTAAADFSARLDALWDFDHPARSEARFRALLAKLPARSRDAYETSTQVARTQGMQRQFAAADGTLDGVARALDRAGARVRVRYSLERGRVRNSSGAADAAVPLFRAALSASADDTEPGAEFYRIDALHMLGIAAPPAERLDWNLQALATADAATDPRARRWRASLLNNLGWTYHDRGDFATALACWEKALAAREETGDASTIRFARWAVARGLRSLDRLDEAEAIQRTLARETEAAGAPDGDVYEELAEIALARHDAAAAQAWAAKAYARLKDDAEVQASEPARLARLARVAGGGPP